MGTHGTAVSAARTLFEKPLGPQILVDFESSAFDSEPMPIIMTAITKTFSRIHAYFIKNKQVFHKQQATRCNMHWTLKVYYNR